MLNNKQNRNLTASKCGKTNIELLNSFLRKLFCVHKSSLQFSRTLSNTGQLAFLFYFFFFGKTNQSRTYYTLVEIETMKTWRATYCVICFLIAAQQKSTIVCACSYVDRKEESQKQVETEIYLYNFVLFCLWGALYTN